jgi:UDP-2,3-diacylglucosamine pyrophosphatase LpxH
MLSHKLNNLRRLLGRPYYPLAERVKLSIGTSLRYIEQFEQLAAERARAQGYDGVVCGHIHRANLTRIGGTLYGNTGDWVESCSALIEIECGELALLRWPRRARGARHAAPQLLVDPA